MTPFYASLADALAELRAKAPLVVNVTNNVVTNFTANVLLALGASPAMSHAPEDAADLAALAGALVLNMGTPAHDYATSMLAAQGSAQLAGVPVVFDPVACGATALRRDLAARIASGRLTAVRGNASEIMALAGADALSKGVDSAHESLQAAPAAKALAARLGCVVCVSGDVDFVTDSRAGYALTGGHPLMTKVTGMGCAATAVTGAFLAVVPRPLEAVAMAMTVMSWCGARAAARAKGPGSLQIGFLDELYALDPAGDQTHAPQAVRHDQAL